MSKNGNRGNEKRNKFGDEQPFQEAMAAIRASNDPANPIVYLGDPDVMDSLVRRFVGKCFDLYAAESEDEQKKQAAIALEEADRLANILLGRDKNHVGISGFHVPGGIDRYIVSKGFAVATDTPSDRIKNALLVAHRDLGEILQWMSEGKIQDDEFESYLDGIAETFGALFMGKLRNSQEEIDADVAGEPLPPQEDVTTMTDYAKSQNAASRRAAADDNQGR